MADNPYFILCMEGDVIFYNGYSLVDTSLEKLQYLQKLMNTRLFWRYIRATSKPYGGQFYALAKNYVKTFGVIEMTEEQRRIFMQMSREEADSYIEALYGVENL